jgi:hypothetical protein
MAEIVHARGRDSGRDHEAEPRHEVMERLADRPRVNRPPPREGEERRIRSRILSAMLAVLVQHVTDARTKRDETGLAELGVADDEQPSAEVDVGKLQPRHLADAKPEPIEQDEDRFVRGRPERRERIVDHRVDQIEQTLHVVGADEERDPPS